MSIDAELNWTLWIKLLVFIALVVSYAIQSLRYAPRLTGVTGQTSSQSRSEPDVLAVVWRKWFLLQKANAALGLMLLLLSLALTRT